MQTTEAPDKSSCKNMIPLQSLGQVADPSTKLRTLANALTSGSTRIAINSNEGYANKNNNKKSNITNIAIGDARDSVSNSRGNSMVKVPCSNDTTLAGHDTDSRTNGTSHLESNVNSIGSSP